MAFLQELYPSHSYCAPLAEDTQPFSVLCSEQLYGYSPYIQTASLSFSGLSSFEQAEKINKILISNKNFIVHPLT